MVMGDHPHKLWSIVGSLPGHPNRENPIFPAYARPVAILQPYPLDTNIWNRPRTHCEAYPGQRGRAPCNHAPEGERCHRLRAHRRQPAPLHLIITASSQPGRRSSWVPTLTCSPLCDARQFHHAIGDSPTLLLQAPRAWTRTGMLMWPLRPPKTLLYSQFLPDLRS